MDIAIIGAGNVGQALATRLAAAGHAVTLGVRDPRDASKKELARRLGCALAEVAAACDPAEAVILAVPYAQARNALLTAGDLSGKTLIDCTNPLTPDYTGLVVGHTTSAAEAVADWAPGAAVFKTFNHMGANVMADPDFGGTRATMFVCGDDAERKPMVLALVEDVGFEAVDAGGLDAARLLEPLAVLWIRLAMGQGMGREIGWKLLRRGGG